MANKLILIDRPEYPICTLEHPKQDYCWDCDNIWGIEQYNPKYGKIGKKLHGYLLYNEMVIERITLKDHVRYWVVRSVAELETTPELPKVKPAWITEAPYFDPETVPSLWLIFTMLRRKYDPYIPSEPNWGFRSDGPSVKIHVETKYPSRAEAEKAFYKQVKTL